MTALGEKLLAFLQAQPDVSMARDASSREYCDGIRCAFGGQNWFIALESGDPNFAVPDPRDGVKEDD